MRAGGLTITDTSPMWPNQQLLLERPQLIVSSLPLTETSKYFPIRSTSSALSPPLSPHPPATWTLKLLHRRMVGWWLEVLIPLSG